MSQDSGGPPTEAALPTIEIPDTPEPIDEEPKPKRRLRGLFGRFAAWIVAIPLGGFGAYSGSDAADEDVVRMIMEERIEFEDEISEISIAHAEELLELRRELQLVRQQVYSTATDLTRMAIDIATYRGAQVHYPEEHELGEVPFIGGPPNVQHEINAMAPAELKDFPEVQEAIFNHPKKMKARAKRRKASTLFDDL